MDDVHIKRGSEMMDDRQTIVNTVDSSDWSGAEPIKYYEADGKYYV